MFRRFYFCLFFTTLLVNNIVSQNNLYNYVDIHNHISMKNYMRSVDYPDSINQSLKYLRYQNWYSPNNNFDINTKSNEENFYQADFTNLANAGFKIICASVTPFEQNSMYNDIKRTANSGFETHIAADRLAHAYASTPIKDFFNEMTFLKSQKSLPVSKENQFHFKVVNNNAELRECLKNQEVAFVTTIEGGHVLYGETSKKHDYFLSPNCSPAMEAEILHNVDLIKNYETRVLFMGICHLFANKIAGHAKALDVSPNSKFNKFVIQKSIALVYGLPFVGKLLDTKYYEGLRDGDVKTRKDFNIDHSTIGLKVIRALLDSNNIHHKPILIDIKHMDIQSRLDYYAMLDSIPAYKNIPIVASHAAASGKNLNLARITGSFPYYDDYSENRKPEKFYRKYWDEWERKYGLTKADYPSQVNFLNPFSINFFDEEIKRIYDSDGLIGIIFEQRTLGGYMEGYSWERKEQLEEDLKAKYKFTGPEVQQYLNSEPFLRNLFYFVEKSGRTDSTAYNVLSLGSDMDGFIDPVNSCLTSSSLPIFAADIERFIPVYIDLNYPDNKILFGLSPHRIVEKVFGENAQNFILKHF